MKRARSFLAMLCTVVIVITCVSFPAAAASPDDPVTRGDAVQMLFEAFFRGLDTRETRFVDILDKPYAEAVIWAERAGLVVGAGNKRFDGERLITRAETAVLTYRFITKLLLPTDETDSTIVISGYEDYADVPSWAIKAMSFAVSGGYLNCGGNMLKPSGTMTKSEFSAVIEKIYVRYLELMGYLVYPESIDYSAVMASNKEINAEIYLGIGIDELEKIFERPFENDWIYYVEGVTITCINNSVVGISTAASRGDQWSFNGVSKKSTGTDVEQIFGVPNLLIPKGSLSAGIIPLTDIAIYFFDSKGKTTEKQDDAVYLLEIEYNDDRSINGIELSSFYRPEIPNVVPPHRLPQSVPQSINGSVSFQVSGSGNSSIINEIGPIICVSISYTGTGNFSILNGDDVLFTHTGPYTGSILLEDMLKKELDILAEGDWSVTGMHTLNHEKFMSVRSGSGDYVFPVFNLSGEYRVSHNGTGPFAVKWVSRVPNPEIDDIIIADAGGSYTGTFEFEFADLGASFGYVVIEAEGDWTFGPNYEFKVVE